MAVGWRDCDYRPGDTINGFISQADSKLGSKSAATGLRGNDADISDFLSEGSEHDQIAAHHASSWSALDSPATPSQPMEAAEQAGQLNADATPAAPRNNPLFDDHDHDVHGGSSVSVTVDTD